VALEPAAPSAGQSPGDFSDVHAVVERHYSGTVARHGATAFGVDWSCVPTQELRFVQLLKLCDFAAPFSLNDVGCGYGALLGFLGRRHRGRSIDYLGVDLSEGMIAHACRMWAKRRHAAFEVAAQSTRVADYSVASGIFNVKLSVPETRWVQFVQRSLDDIHATSRRGFAVNFLAQLPLGIAGKAELYRTDAKSWAAYCRKRYHAKVEVLAAYGMREFTLLVSY
jgi:SAM-dependent methyltransferase